MNYGMFYRTIFFFFFCMKVLDTKELLYSVYVKYYNNVLLKKKFTNISSSVEMSWTLLWLKQSVLHVLYVPYVTASFNHRAVTSMDN